MCEQTLTNAFAVTDSPPRGEMKLLWLLTVWTDERTSVPLGLITGAHPEPDYPATSHHVSVHTAMSTEKKKKKEYFCCYKWNKMRNAGEAGCLVWRD